MHPADQQRNAQRSGRAVNQALPIFALVVGALMMAAAIGTPAHAWLGWFALVPLFFVIRRWRPMAAILGGALWGVLIFVFSAAQPAAPITPNIQSLVLLTMLPAIYAGFGATITRWIGFNPVILGFAWMGVELALAPTGLRTGILGGGSLMHWVGEALGYVVAAFLVALVSASLVSLLSTVQLTWAQQRCVSQWRDGQNRFLFPQTSAFLPFAAVTSVKPRAPPICLAAP